MLLRARGTNRLDFYDESFVAIVGVSGDDRLDLGQKPAQIDVIYK